MTNIKTQHDIDALETQEWLDSLKAVIAEEGPERAHFLIEQLIDLNRRSGGHLPYQATTAYLNTIPVTEQKQSPGDSDLEWKIRAIIRWNAMAMVVRANRRPGSLGGHIASFASAATIYDVGFNHFFRGKDHPSGGDLLYVQGHSSPGFYARAFLEGRISEEQLDKFREEVGGKGLPSYPHSWLMPDFWQFATVSMGLGPIQAIYQARFMKYLQSRGIIEKTDRKVYCFLGDGETDEPESLGAISLAGRENLDNLVFVINCNLQRLDGPVRGNGKIIQELEGVFRGAGWNVIKVIWGSYWDKLFAKDTDGLLRKRMEEAVDGDYQMYKSKDGAYVREHFFGKYPELKAMVSHMTDDDIWRLNRGGHDPHKMYAAYSEATSHEGQPTVILAKTVKGYGMGPSGQAANTTHQQKKMDTEAIREFRNKFNVPIKDDQLEEVPYYKPADDSEEMKYMLARREELGGFLPQRSYENQPLDIPEMAAFESITKGSGDREISTTMAFVRSLAVMLRDKNIKEKIVPIICDEARTFGMEGLFRQLGIYSHQGQKYEPEDSDQLMFYKESEDGQVLQEGITEAGAMCSWIAAATSYANYNTPMIPFYIYYSMFGHQRIGDLCWAAGDMRAKGFLLGGTSGRTTLNGEGLQHQDGHSHLIASTVPNCISYDPTYGYEVVVILQSGLKRMFVDNDEVYYYITLLNENYPHPEMPKDCEAGIIKGLYKLKERPKKGKAQAQLLGSGSILREVEAAADMLHKDFEVACDVWSATSFTELKREGQSVQRHNRLHADKKTKLSYVEQCLDKQPGPVIAASDYVHDFAEQIRPWVKAPYATLGTDGFGRSDTREQLREFFEVSRNHIAYTTVVELVKVGDLPKTAIKKAIKTYNIQTDLDDPRVS
ncbi:pyruvate dehydrogenase E1 component [Marinicella pacifica]|uniref:Pyruvate dehydrogenase E1 component n=1 Tax=Marinicella pacifica TaxID=1171543 RepID=A0A917CSX2_9GAMM|nr:pyruvate dehydrogenase (acetyl-transferring), homodimeric type [Marinicella pacifica]GGF98545.1 pyruvate dehydrogenase E1 component [Marinicella pacifica]